MTAVDLGPLKKLRIRHDNSHSQSSWYLDRVEIVDTKDDTTYMNQTASLLFIYTLCFFKNRFSCAIRYYFPCNRWLAVDEDDGQIARELVPVDEAFMKKDEDEEGTSTTLGLEQKCNTLNPSCILVKGSDKPES